MFDRTNAGNLAALKSEVINDPNGYGYDPTATTDILAIINKGRPEVTVSKPKISKAQVISACTFDAYDGAAIDKQEWLRWITEGATEAETLVITQDVRDRLTGALGGSVTGDSIWAVADDDAMESAMLALIDVEGSRAEELFGFGTSISRDDWIAARDS